MFANYLVALMQDAKVAIFEMLGKKKYKKEIDDVLAARAELVKSLKEQVEAHDFLLMPTFISVPILKVCILAQYDKKTSLEERRDSEAAPKPRVNKEEMLERVVVHFDECRRLRSYLDRLYTEIRKQAPAIVEAILKGFHCREMVVFGFDID